MPAAPTTSQGFTQETFQFLRELSAHNEKPWFEANKSRYIEDVQRPSLAFVRAVGPGLIGLSRHLHIDDRPVGGSVMRIYRDVRFSKDKRPYKTAVGIRFSNQSCPADEPFPGFFLHIAPGESTLHSGAWYLEGPHLQKMREAIAKRSKEWAVVRKAVGGVDGEALKRPPAGFDAEHPFIEDIKRKGFHASVEFSDAEVTRADFAKRFVAACEKVDPLNRFIAKAAGVPY
jgi:uncharacterized protein (TIGR02453 family)